MAAGAASAPAAVAEDAFTYGYENGAVSSVHPRVYRAFAPAPDASHIVTEKVRYGHYAVAHKTVVGDPDYYAAGLRAESSTFEGSPTSAQIPTYRSYEFSFSLKDWQDWEGTYDKNIRDVIWQFKRDNGSGADGYFAIRQNRLDFNSPNTGQSVVLPDLRPYDNKWIDIRIDVDWATDPTGRFVVGVRLPGQADYTTVLDRAGIVTWAAGGGNGQEGKVQWGDFRPNSSLENHAPLVREIHHDNLRIATTRLPPPPLAAPGDGHLTGGGRYVIRRANTTQALTNPGLNTAGVQQVIAPNRRSLDQQWIPTAQGDGTYTLRNALSHQCLDVKASSTGADAHIIQWPCHGKANQRWTLVPSGSGYALISARSGLGVTPNGSGRSSVLNQEYALDAWQLTPLL